MAKQAQGAAGMDRTTELALELFLKSVTADATRTLEHLAKEAFEKAEAFWAFADSRKEK